MMKFLKLLFVQDSKLSPNLDRPCSSTVERDTKETMGGILAEVYFDQGYIQSAISDETRVQEIQQAPGKNYSNHDWER